MLSLKCFEVVSLRMVTSFTWDEKVGEIERVEASVKIRLRGKGLHVVATGNGNEDAFFKALIKALEPEFPCLKAKDLACAPAGFMEDIAKYVESLISESM